MKHFQIRQSITDRSTISVDLYLKDIYKYNLLTEEEELNLFKEYKENQSEAAKTKLIQSNLRFVVSIAKQYLNQGVELSDLIANGNLGLIKAVEEYNIDSGVRFVSYAVWWIRNFILAEITKSNNFIKIPGGRLNLLNKINKATNYFEVTQGRQPTEIELADYLEVDEADIHSVMLDNLSIVNNTVQNSDGEEECIFDTIASENQADAELENSLELEAILKNIASVLNQMEYDVLVDMFGLKTNALNIEQISQKYSITKERVRQIKDKAIIKLRKSDNINELMKFL